MKRRNNFYLSNILLAGALVLSFQSCSNGRNKDNIQSKELEEISQEIDASYTYNFYIENSGSVKGYFKGKSNDAEVIIKEFYDRIDEKLKSDEKITLNYINNQIKPQKCSIDQWLNSIYTNCNASFSDLDKFLEQILQLTDNKTVNFVISDYCFESKDGDLRKAQSGITKIFTKALDRNKDLSVSIYKYEASFSGNYFPGRINFVGNRPLYIWIFGPSNALRKISKLNTEQEKENEMFLQSSRTIIPQVQTNNKRMTNKDRTCLNVKHWQEDRYESDVYKVDLKVSTKNLMLPKSAIQNIENYTLIPNNYYIDNIQYFSDDEYIYTIATEHPSPCTLKINYTLDIPEWVITSNYEGTSLPKDSTTYGIKYLIEGVSNAYKNQNSNIFDIKLIIK
jgi:hypothetical protein